MEHYESSKIQVQGYIMPVEHRNKKRCIERVRRIVLFYLHQPSPKPAQYSAVPREIPSAHKFSQWGKGKTRPPTDPGTRPTHSLYQPACSESLARLIDEALFLLKAVFKNWKTWLLLQMLRNQCKATRIKESGKHDTTKGKK